MVTIRSLVLWCSLVFACVAYAAEPSTAYLSLSGYLGTDEIASTLQELESLSKAPPKQLVIEVDSVSGDVSAVLDLASKIYELKNRGAVSVVVFVKKNAIGPAAILPFLSDQLLTTPYVSWGAIPYGNEESVPANILKSRVSSLIPAKNPNAQALALLAAAMADPKVKGETLVLNQNQLQEQGLVKEMLTFDEFLLRFGRAVVPSQSETSIAAIPQTDLEKRLAQHIVFNPNGPNTVGHIAVDDRTSGISSATWLYVKSALDAYKKSKPIFIVLELNTPGGEVYPAQQISDALKEMDTQYDIPIVAYVNNWAISAGAMLAYSSRFIVVAKDASMGAAEPVLLGASGQMVEASEKVNSALRADFANRANFFGRNPLLAEAMVDKDPILVFRHGKIVKLNAEDQIQSKGPHPDVMIKAKGKLLTLDANKLMQYGVADMLVEPLKVAPIAEAEKESGQWSANQMALFKQPFFERIPHATIDAYRPDWRVQFLAFLAKPAIASLLLMGLMIGAYMEMSSPGAALPGSVAIICLLLIILSSYSQQAAGWLELVLVLAGLALLAIEVFVLPTWGLLGFVGICSILIGLFALMLPSLGSVSFDFDTQTWNAAGQVFVEQLAWFCGTLILSVWIIALLWRYVMPRFTPLNRLVLAGGEQEASRGYYAGPNPAKLPQVGAKGVAVATLRPAGKVSIVDRVYDAMSAGDFIEEGEPIVVIRLESGRIVVGKDGPGGTR